MGDAARGVRTEPTLSHTAQQRPPACGECAYSKCMGRVECANVSVILMLKMVTDEQISALLALPVPERLAQYVPEGFVPEGEAIDTDAAWHALHFVLTGRVQGGELPAASLLAGGAVVGPSVLAPSRTTIPSGLGERDRVLSSGEVAAFDAYLATVTDEAFRRRFDALYSSMDEIYPGIWRGDRERDAADLLLSFHAVKDFVRKAHERGRGLLLHFA